MCCSKPLSLWYGSSRKLKLSVVQINSDYECEIVLKTANGWIQQMGMLMRECLGILVPISVTDIEC